MLGAHEFTVGTLADATPLSLMLPRTKHEATFLIGRTENASAAVFIGGEYSFEFFECSPTTNWSGLLIPNVRIEVDETSLFDPTEAFGQPGTVVRTDTRLVVYAQIKRHFPRHSEVILQAELPASQDLKAAFSKWRIVLVKVRTSVSCEKPIHLSTQRRPRGPPISLSSVPPTPKFPLRSIPL